MKINAIVSALRGAAAIQYVNSQYIRITIANIAFVLHDGLLSVQWAQKFNHNLLQRNLIGPDVTNLFTS